MTTHAVRVCMTDIEGKALLQLRRENGNYFFCFFGGRVEPDEHPINAAVREIQEELDFDIFPEELEYLATWRNNENVEVLHYRLKRAVAWQNVSTGEDFGIAMVPYADLPSIPLAESMKWFYQQYPELPK